MNHKKIITSIVRILTLLILSVFSFQLLQAQETAEQNNAAEKEEVRVICYNILEGFSDRPNNTNRMGKFVEWIKEKDPEVVALQELTGFTQVKLEKLAKSYGHPYAIILKESGYAVGLTSKKPIELKKRMLEGQWHGTLHARTYGVDMFVIHLSPHSWKLRLKDAKAICNYIEEQKLEKYIVMGDFNAYSPYDADKIEAQSYLISREIKRDEKSTKHKNIRGKIIDYSTLSTFLSLPMEDVVRMFVKPEQRLTCPSRIGAKSNKPVYTDRVERIDYILLSPSLLKDCVDATILHDETTHYLSDHYPVGVDIMLDK